MHVRVAGAPVEVLEDAEALHEHAADALLVAGSVGQHLGSVSTANHSRAGIELQQSG